MRQCEVVIELFQPVLDPVLCLLLNGDLFVQVFIQGRLSGSSLVIATVLFKLEATNRPVFQVSRVYFVDGVVPELLQALLFGHLASLLDNSSQLRLVPVLDVLVLCDRQSCIRQFVIDLAKALFR